MRIINIKGNSYCREIKVYKIELIDSLVKDIAKYFENEDGYIKYETLNIYKENSITQRLKVTFVFTLYMGKSFKETIIYSLYSDLDMDFFILNIGFAKETKTYKEAEIEKVKKFIIEDILKKLN